MGIVLPWGVFSAKGSVEWRRTVFAGSSTSVTLCDNRDEWLFTDVNPGYAICLVDVARHGSPSEQGTLEIRGRFGSLKEYEEGKRRPPASLSTDDLSLIDENWCLPAFHDVSHIGILKKLLQHPKFGASDRIDFRVRPNRELDVTNDKYLFTNRNTDTPVHNHLNVGRLDFDHDAGEFTYCEEDRVIEELIVRRIQRYTRKDSPFFGMPEDWVKDESTLPVFNPRIVFRSPVHATNPRKVWFALAPPGTILTNAAPYLLFWHGGTLVQAYLLGMMSSEVLDWVGHLKMNLNLNYFILYTFPVPIFDQNSQQALRIAELAAGLSTTKDYEWGEWSEIAQPIVGAAERLIALAELDACAASVLGLTEMDLCVIFEDRIKTPDGVAYFSLVLDHYRRCA